MHRPPPAAKTPRASPATVFRAFSTRIRDLLDPRALHPALVTAAAELLGDPPVVLFLPDRASGDYLLAATNTEVPLDTALPPALFKRAAHGDDPRAARRLGLRRPPPGFAAFVPTLALPLRQAGELLGLLLI